MRVAGQKLLSPADRLRICCRRRLHRMQQSSNSAKMHPCAVHAVPLQKAEQVLRLTQEADRAQLVTEYDAARLEPQGVLFGLGGFSRAHLCWLLHQLACAGDAAAGITAVAMVSPDLAVLRGMQKQSGTYTHVRRATDGGVEGNAVSTICETLFALDEADTVAARVADPATKFIATVITEGAYAVNLADGSAAAESLSSGEPRLSSWYGLLIDCLHARFTAGLEPCAVIPMDNVPDNGKVIASTLKRCAELRYGLRRGRAEFAASDFAAWLERAPTPSTMVDRITPGMRAYATPPHPLVTDVLATFNIEDAVPVQCERTLYWVIEDVPGPQGELLRRLQAAVAEQPGVHIMIVPDVKPYEQAKAGLLNGQHVPLGLCGAVLLPEPQVSEAMQVPELRGYLERYQAEVTPALAKEPPEFVEFAQEFAGQLHERFSNPALPDTCARLCAYTSDRYLNFIAPYVHANAAVGRPVTCLAAATVLWCVHAAGSDAQSSDVEWEQQPDGRREALQQQARAEMCDGEEGAFLQYGDLLPDGDSFVPAMQALHDESVFREEFVRLVQIVRNAATVQEGVRSVLGEAAA